MLQYDRTFLDLEVRLGYMVKNACVFKWLIFETRREKVRFISNTLNKYDQTCLDVDK